MNRSGKTEESNKELYGNTNNDKIFVFKAPYLIEKVKKLMSLEKEQNDNFYFDNNELSLNKHKLITSPYRNRTNGLKTIRISFNYRSASNKDIKH